MIADEIADLLKPGRVVLVGEQHGTNEYPKLIADVIDRVLTSVDEVIVGLEIPLSEDVSTPSFGAFFDRPPELLDGRSSTAMADLITHLATAEGARTVAMDGPWVGPGAPIPLEHIGLLDQPRDAVMAGRLLAEIDLVPKAPVIVLAGGEHTRVDRQQRTLGGLLFPWFPRLVSVKTLAPGGSAWTLTANGPGIHDVVASPGLPIGLEWTSERGADGFHGYLNVGPVSASPPLRPPV